MTGAPASGAAAVAALYELQGIPLAPERAAKVAAALAPSLSASAADVARLDGEAAEEYLAAAEALAWRP